MQDDCPLFSEGVDRHSVLQAAAMAAKWWEPPRDALDAMVLNAAALHELEGYSHTDFMPFDPSIKVSSPLIMAPNLEHSFPHSSTGRKAIYLALVCKLDGTCTWGRAHPVELPFHVHSPRSMWNQCKEGGHTCRLTLYADVTHWVP